MPKFKVHVVRTAYRHADLEIEAADPLDAIAEAQKRLDADKIDWSSEKDAETDIDGCFSDEPLEPMPESVREKIATIRKENL